jgi:hypothetical protein
VSAFFRPFKRRDRGCFLDHAALIRWVEIDRVAQRRLDDARGTLEGQIAGDGVSPPEPVFIDIRKCVVAFAAWTDLEIGRQSVRLYGQSNRVEPRDLTKVIAAARASIDTVTLPARNRRDFHDIPPSARDRLGFVWLDSVDDAVTETLTRECNAPSTPQ